MCNLFFENFQISAWRRIFKAQRVITQRYATPKLLT